MLAVTLCGIQCTFFTVLCFIGVQTLQLSDGLDEEPENDLFGARLLNFEVRVAQVFGGW